MGTAQEYINYKGPDDLPATLRPRDVGAYLGINEAKAYQLFNRKDFPSFKIGQRWVCTKKAFIRWLKSQYD